MENVERQSDVGDDVDDGDRQVAQAVGQVAVRDTTHVVGVRQEAPGEVGQVEDQVQKDDWTGPAHGAAGVVGGHIVTAARVGLLAVHEVGVVAGLPADFLGGVCGSDVQAEHGDEAKAQHPQQPGAGDDLATEATKRFGVFV